MAGCLYIHVPFCIRKCVYCDFPSIPFDRALSESYVEALIQEIRLRAGGRLGTVYMGGGTPTVLSVEALGEVFRAIREGFDLEPDAEITVEANPGTLDEAKIGALLGLGANRISVGVQSFKDRELSVLGRLHTALQAERTLKALKGENFSIDLIYGIPGQGLEDWRYSVSRALSFGPEHVSAYELTPEEGTPLFRMLKGGVLRLPDEEEVIGMMGYAIDALGSAGYGHYEISSYALPGRASRHNLNYWERGEYVGLGPGAHSFVGKRRWKNTEDVLKYIGLLSAGTLPREEETEVTPEEALRERVFLGLRKTEGIDLKGPGLAALAEASRELAGDGFLEVDGGRLRLTRKGLLLYNQVMVRLLGKLESLTEPADRR
jgi:oxygen-independent coproporphyrinogen-3 oxidase